VRIVSLPAAVSHDLRLPGRRPSAHTEADGFQSYPSLWSDMAPAARPTVDMIEAVRQFSLRLGRDPVARRDEAFGALFEAQFDRIYAFARFRTADEAAAEDIAAEVFARAWSKLRDPADVDAATAWLFTTARRLVVDHYR